MSNTEIHWSWTYSPLRHHKNSDGMDTEEKNKTKKNTLTKLCIYFKCSISTMQFYTLVAAQKFQKTKQ